MINLGSTIEVNIEKLTYNGLGLARFGEEKFVVFVENSVPFDVLKVKITSLNKKFAKAEIVEIIEPSKFRVKPLCPLFNACGSCSHQNCNYDFLIKQKTNILKEIFSNIVDESKIPDCIKSDDVFNYRHKVQYPIRRTKNSKRLLLGYFKNKTHELTNIKFCPNQPDIINEITRFIRSNYLLDCFCEKTNKGLTKNVLFRISSDDENILMTFVLNTDENEFNKLYRHEFVSFFEKITAKFPEIKGTFVNFNPKNTNKILGKTTLKILGNDFIIETLGEIKYKIGAVSFFQVNPKTAVKIFDIVKNNIKENSTVLDAYGGVGTIGIWCKDKASKITLVEENENAVSMAKDNFKLNNVENYEILMGDAKNHLINFKNEKRKFDYVILDPPRAGVEKEGLETISAIAKNIVYVSCNPMTLKRDIEILKDNFEIDFIQGVDLFPNTSHIESVCILKGKS